MSHGRFTQILNLISHFHQFLFYSRSHFPKTRSILILLILTLVTIPKCFAILFVNRSFKIFFEFKSESLQSRFEWDHYKKTSELQLLYIFVGISSERAYTNEIPTKRVVGKKKFRRKFVTNSDETLSETDSSTSDGEPTTGFIGITFIGNLSEIFPTAVFIGNTFPTKYIFRTFLTVKVRRNIPTKFRKRLELRQNFVGNFWPNTDDL